MKKIVFFLIMMIFMSGCSYKSYTIEDGYYYRHYRSINPNVRWCGFDGCERCYQNCYGCCDGICVRDECW